MSPVFPAKQRLVMLRKILVLGIGNLLMGDEGAGVHAARLLEQESLGPDVTVVDGGTGGFHLLSYLQEYSKIIMIDACMDGRPPGTLCTIKPRFASDFPRTLSAHDIGLRDLIESAALLGALPEIFLITVSIAEIRSLEMQLSAPVAGSLPQIVSQVKNILSEALDDR
jgi:hydrogenase maturation protease